MWPKSIKESVIVAFVALLIPYVYHFELFIVLPRYMVQWSPWYIFHFTMGTFLLFNVCSNMVAVILSDTSIKGRMLPTDIGPNTNFCSVCECVTPPRSHHCDICKICVLKRDHHCVFTSCCIGHYNQRYFIMFVFYLFIATTYCTYYNALFIYASFDWTLESLVKIMFPLATLFVKYSTIQLYMLLVVIIALSCVFTGVLTYFHVDCMLRGRVCFEKNKNISPYDCGRIENVRTVLGERWYLIWLSPFIESQLTHDGMNWNTKQSDKAK